MYQACYGKPDNKNWTLFNVSDDMPQDARAVYERAVNAHTPSFMSNDDMIDANGDPLCAFEILSDSGYTVVSKTKYGSKDNFGRATMLSHGFIFETNDIMNDPRYIVAIADVNFRFDVEDTKSIPKGLILEDGFSIKESMAACGLDPEKMYELMKAIYISINSASNFPLYVIAENKDKIFRHLVFCIYKLLPKALRSIVSLSNANIFSRASFKNVMVVDKRMPSGYFFDLSTGETNIDTEDFEVYPEKYQPISRMMLWPDVDEYLGYLNKLETTLMEFCKSEPVSYDNIRFGDARLFWAYDTGAFTQDKFNLYLLDLLSYSETGNKDVDDIISEIVEAYNQKYDSPNDVVMEKIRIRAVGTESLGLREAYKSLIVKKVLCNGDEGVVSFLKSKSFVGYEDFNSRINLIKEQPAGILGIAEYFRREIAASKSKQELAETIEKYRSLDIGEDITDAVNEKEMELFGKGLGLNAHQFDSGQPIANTHYFQQTSDNGVSVSGNEICMVDFVGKQDKQRIEIMPEPTDSQGQVGMESMQEMPPQVQGMPPQVQGMPPQVQGMPQQVQGMPQQVQGMPQQVQGMPQQVQGMSQQVQGMPQQVQGMPPQVQGMSQQVQGMSQTMPQQGYGMPQETPPQVQGMSQVTQQQSCSGQQVMSSLNQVSMAKALYEELFSLDKNVKNSKELVDGLKIICGNFENEIEYRRMHPDDICVLAQAICNYSLDRKENINSEADITYWIRLAFICAVAMRENPCKLLFDWNIDSIMDPNRFYEEITEFDIEYIEEFVRNVDFKDDSYVVKLGVKSDEYKLWKKHISNLKSYIKKEEKKKHHSGESGDAMAETSAKAKSIFSSFSRAVSKLTTKK